MSRILVGLLAGLVFGLIDVIIMIPMPEKDKKKKKEAMIGAFLERFMIGLIIPNIDLGLSSVIEGFIIGIGLSIPTAVITRVYVPIVGIGAVGGLIIGLISNSIL